MEKKLFALLPLSVLFLGYFRYTYLIENSNVLKAPLPANSYDDNTNPREGINPGFSQPTGNIKSRVSDTPHGIISGPTEGPGAHDFVDIGGSVITPPPTAVEENPGGLKAGTTEGPGAHQSVDIGGSVITPPPTAVEENPEGLKAGTTDGSIQPPAAPYLNETCYTYVNTTAINNCCTMLQYTADDLNLCANNKAKGFENPTKKTRLALFGDSRARIFTVTFGYLLNGTNATYYYEKGNTRKTGPMKDVPALFRKHNKRGTIHLVSNESPLVITYYDDRFLDNLPEMIEKWIIDQDSTPDVILMVAGLHYSMTRGKQVPKYKKKIQNLLPRLAMLRKQTKIVFQIVDPALFQYFSARYQELFAREILDSYNEVLYSLFPRNGSNIVLWDSTYKLADQYAQNCYPRERNDENFLWDCNDLTHVGNIATHQYRNMLLNHACNRYMSLTQDYCS